MSQLDKRALGTRRMVILALAAGWGGASAQTISDYSRAQRGLLEATMSQAAVRSALLGASAAAPSSPSPRVAAALVPQLAPAAPRRPVEATEPVIRIGGVFASASRSMAEVAVDGNVYLLCAGQGVPGTSWLVDTVAADQVVLARTAGSPADVAGWPQRRTFALAALR